MRCSSSTNTSSNGRTSYSKNYQQECDNAIFDVIALQQYDDDISQYSETAVKEAIAAELASLRNKDLFDAISASKLTPEQLKKVIKTKWIINSGPRLPRPSMMACFIAKTFSHNISNPTVETFP